MYVRPDDRKTGGSEVSGNHEALSPREREIASLVKQGHTNRKIAEELKISEHTVRNHVSAIFEKLGVTGRLQLAIYAHKNKL